jgi:hypothetical protein
MPGKPIHIRLSEKTAIRLSLGYAAYCVCAAALGFVDGLRPLVAGLFYLAFGLCFVVMFVIAAGIRRRISSSEMWHNAPDWCRDFVILAAGWFLVSMFGSRGLFERPFDRGRVGLGAMGPMGIMLPFAMFTALNALGLMHFLAAGAGEADAEPEVKAKGDALPAPGTDATQGEIVRGVPRAVTATLVLALILLFANEIADVFLRSYSRTFLPSRASGYSLDCGNPKCGEVPRGCVPKTYTLCENLEGRDGTARYYRGLTITTYHFKDAKVGQYSELLVSGILCGALIVAGVVLVSLADRRGAPFSDVRVRLSNIPRAHVPAVCGLILIAAAVLSAAKLFLLQGLPELLSAARGAL